MKKIFLSAVGVLAASAAFAQPKLTADNIDEIINALATADQAEKLKNNS